MKVELTAALRTHAGKGIARQLRRNGQIPGVLYGQGDCLLLKLDPTALVKLLRSSAGSTALIALRLDGGEKARHATALLRDYQIDPLTGKLLHVDFFEVSMTKAIRVKVPIHVVGGTPIGVKEGGVLHHNLRELTIECLPGAIPDAIEVDASMLKIGQGIHVRELRSGEGVRLLDEGEQMVISVAAPMSEEKLEALLTSGAAPAEEAEGPEVVGKEKEAVEAAEKGAAGTEPKAEKKETKEEKKK